MNKCPIFNYNSLTDCDGSKVVQLFFSASYSRQNKVYFFDMLSFKSSAIFYKKEIRLNVQR